MNKPGPKATYTTRKEKLARNRELYQLNLEKNRERIRLWMHNSDRTVKGRYYQTFYSAKERKLLFTLTLEEYTKLLAALCYYCNNVLKKNEEHGIGLDRIDNSKDRGYTIDNVLPCCGTCNKIRQDLLTVEETKVVISTLIEFRKNKIL
ncbi:MAG TPA: hypothetical protein VKR58_03375, partial [Aquella sp.]|nr:hypothetical protein [Aquella sp.]